MRVLLTGWPSLVRGAATAGELLGMGRLADALERTGVDHDVAWSPAARPDPARYSHLVFACGPAHGSEVRALHDRFHRCRRIAVGVTVVDPSDPAVTGFDAVLAGETPGDGSALAADPAGHLAAAAGTDRVPVVGVLLGPDQHEHGERRLQVHRRLGDWLADKDCARVPVDPRLGPGLDARPGGERWRCPSTPNQLDSLLCRLDAVVTTWLPGLVLALRHGVPAVTVDPVSGGGALTAQADAWRWPGLLDADAVLADTDALDTWWRWCLSSGGRRLAAQRASAALRDGERLVSDLLRSLESREPARGTPEQARGTPAVPTTRWTAAPAARATLASPDGTRPSGEGAG